MTVFRRSTLALAALALLALPYHAHAQRLRITTEEEAYRLYDALQTMEAWGVNGTVEGGRVAAIVAEEFGFDMPGDPWSWDLEAPYQGAFYCSEKDRKVRDATMLLISVSLLAIAYGAAAGIVAPVNPIVAAYFATGVPIMASAAASASALRMQLIGTMCIPD